MKFSRIISLTSSLLLFNSVAPTQAQPIDSFQSEPASLPTPNSFDLNAPLQFSPPPLPSRGRPTGRRRGGASRGGCDIAGQLPLTAMVPAYNNNNEIADASESTHTFVETVFSLTAQPRPSFWFYVPYSLATTPLEFVLQDESNQTIYQGSVSSEASASSPLADNSNGGVIQVTLPDSVPALEADTLYHWYFVAYCNETDPAFVEGWVAQQPHTAALSTALTNTTPREQAGLYAQNGLWQDSITALGERYKQDPTDSAIASDWETLLESVDLSELSTQQIQDCCTLE
ncbi:MAG: DUF928 domain-containing protein [Cyanobacteria bacterium J06598_1]